MFSNYLILKRFVLIICLGIGAVAFSQTKRIKIIHADNTFTTPEYPGAIVSLGNVMVEHEGATLRCDKAYIYQETNLMKALGNVIINQGDTIHQYSKYTDYDGNTKLATSWGNVILKDPMMTLRTDTLYFDRVEQHLYYRTGGTIKDTTNLLKSRIGNYYLETNKFQAFTKVNVTNPDTDLESDHLDYYTNTGIAELYGPSTITSDENSIYTEDGHHNSKTNISYFLKQSKIFYGDRTIEGDSLYYDKNIEYASATGNIKVIDTANNSVIKGGYAEYFKPLDSVYITDKAVAISVSEDQDSMFIHGKKILITGPAEDRLVRVFHRVKMFKSDLQGKCDSLVSYENTGLTELITNPVLWAEGNQITGDTIHLLSNTKTEQLDSLKILGNGFMIEKDSAGFSQMKGKLMLGKFENNQISNLDVIGNSEVIKYSRDEFYKLIAISRMQSSKNIYITFKDNQIQFIDFVEKPDGKTYPPSKFPEDQALFKGFLWRESERPRNKEEIFIYDEEESPDKAPEELSRE